jgi:hypothetical protein
MWKIERTQRIKDWIFQLDDDAKEAILKNLYILQELGPKLGRPYVDTIKNSKYKNMKELRIQNKKRVYRILFIFDTDRNAVLLIGGDKKSDKNFYSKMIPLAEKLYENYLNERR